MLGQEPGELTNAEAPGRVSSAQNGEERFVDAPHLLGGRVPDALAETLHVDRPDQFDENSGSLLGDDHLRSERGRLGAARSGATRSPDRGNSASACTTTANRRPGCSYTTLFGTLNSKMSPRCTHELHERRPPRPSLDDRRRPPPGLRPRPRARLDARDGRRRRRAHDGWLRSDYNLVGHGVESSTLWGGSALRLRTGAGAVHDVGAIGIPAVVEHDVAHRPPPQRTVTPSRPADDKVTGEHPFVGNPDRPA